MHSVPVAVEERSRFLLQFEQDALRREGDDAVLERAVLSGRLLHDEVLGHVGGEFELAVAGVERQSGRLVGQEYPVRVAGVDDRPHVAALDVHLLADQRRDEGAVIDLHAVVARKVRALVDFDLDFGVGVERRDVHRVDVADHLVAPFAFGRFPFGHQLPARAEHRERKARSPGTVDRNVVRIYDADVARVGLALLGVGEGDGEFGLLLARTEDDRFDFENLLRAGRDLDRNRDGVEIPGAADLVGDLGLFRGIQLHLRRRSLGREIDAVVIRVLLGAGRVGRVVRAADGRECRQECP